MDSRSQTSSESHTECSQSGRESTSCHHTEHSEKAREGHPSTLPSARIRDYIALTENFRFREFWYRHVDEWGQIAYWLMGAGG